MEGCYNSRILFQEGGYLYELNLLEGDAYRVDDGFI